MGDGWWHTACLRSAIPFDRIQLSFFFLLSSHMLDAPIRAPEQNKFDWCQSSCVKILNPVSEQMLINDLVFVFARACVRLCLRSASVHSKSSEFGFSFIFFALSSNLLTKVAHCMSLPRMTQKTHYDKELIFNLLTSIIIIIRCVCRRLQELGVPELCALRLRILFFFPSPLSLSSSLHNNEWIKDRWKGGTKKKVKMRIVQRLWCDVAFCHFIIKK